VSIFIKKATEVHSGAASRTVSDEGLQIAIGKKAAYIVGDDGADR
jgi:hypothetical protein